MAAATEALFSYGTLQLAPVQRATFGRTPQGQSDQLPGFRLGARRIDDPGVVAVSGQAEHPIVHGTGDPADSVPGTVLMLTPAEVGNADTYEVSAYQRAAAPLASGRRIWVYVDARRAPPGARRRGRPPAKPRGARRFPPSGPRPPWLAPSGVPASA